MMQQQRLRVLFVTFEDNSASFLGNTTVEDLIEAVGSRQVYHLKTPDVALQSLDFTCRFLELM